MDIHEESLKHLRNVHFTLILSSAIIFLSSMSINKIYDRSIEQLRDTLSLSKHLSAETFNSNLLETCPAEFGTGYEPETQFSDGLDNLLDPMFSEAELDDIDLSSSIYFNEFLWGGDAYYYEYEYDAESSPFHKFGCLLVAGDIPYAYPEFEVSGISTNTVSALSKSMDSLLKFDKILGAPTFYHLDNIVVHYSKGEFKPNQESPKITFDKFSELVSSFESVSGSVTVSGVQLTSDADRRVIEGGYEAMTEDPEAFDYGSANPDYLFLELFITEQGPLDRKKRSMHFFVEFPVLFQTHPLTIVEEVFQKELPGKPYYASYLSGNRTFETLYPELFETTKNLSSLDINEAIRYLEYQKKNAGGSVDILSLKLNRDLIEVWGIVLLLAIHLYFFLHIKNYFSFARNSDENDINYPWVVIYKDRLSFVVSILTQFIPFFICSYIAYTQYTNYVEIPALNIFYLGVSMVLSLLVSSEIVRYRNASKNHLK